MRLRKEDAVVTESDCRVEIQNYKMILEDALKVLDENERVAIFLRFWQSTTIAQVANQLKIPWASADCLIDQAVEKIRCEFRRHKYYNRKLGEPISY